MADEGEGTYSHEEALGDLPVPNLKETLEKYLRSAKPFLTEQEYEHTEAVTKDFQEGVGQELQEQLVGRAKTEKNWVEEWWETFAYLQPRYPVAVNVNWHGVVPGSWPGDVTQAEAAASLTYATLQFCKELDDETLPAETMAGQKLSMHQFRRMFRTCRVPHEGMDEFRVTRGAKHIVVLRRNALFAVDVMDDSGQILPASVIRKSLEQVVDATATMFNMGKEPAISVLTSENRDTWAAAREHLLSLGAGNEASMEQVETAIFSLVLSTESPTTDEDIARNALHGDGRDKWFDKPFNLIVHENARVGLNGEHGWADAIAVVSCFTYVLNLVKDAAQPSRATRVEVGAAVPEPRKLEWVVDAKSTQWIERASTNFLRLSSTVDLRVLTFHHFGKDFIKRYSLVPDFFVQMAIQLAYWKLCGKVVAVYESGHTRLFYHGRTETIRSCSEESVAFCRAMTDPNAADGDRFKALKTAVKRQREIVRDALLGQGIDRHLMGLYILSEMQGLRPRPAFFTDRGYVESSRYVLSTSNIGSSPVWGGFMAMHTDGFGVCYGIEKDRINISITANNDEPGTSATEMRSALQASLVQMQELCLTREVMYLAKPKL